MAQAGGLLGGVAGAGGAGVAPVNFNGENEEAEEPNVSPEEQAQYDKFVGNAMELIYTEDGKVQDEVLARLSTGNKPMDVLAQTTVWLVMLVENSAEQSGQRIEDDVLFHAAKEVHEQLIEVAEAADIHTFKEAEVQGSWYQALDMYREANSDEGGRFNPEVAAQEFAALNEADREGRADEVLPGFSQMTQAGLAAAMADGNPVDGEDEDEGEI